MEASCHPVAHMDNDGRTAHRPRRSSAFTQQPDLEVFANFFSATQLENLLRCHHCVFSHPHLSVISQDCFPSVSGFHPSSKAPRSHFMWLLNYFCMWCYNQLEHRWVLCPSKLLHDAAIGYGRESQVLPGLSVLWFLSHMLTSRRYSFQEVQLRVIKNTSELLVANAV